jgi:dienelactone hydrolase
MKHQEACRSSASITMAVARTSLAVLVLMALAACGGSGTTASTAPSAAPSTATATASPSPTWTPTMSPAPIPVVKPGQKPPPFSELKAMFAYDTSEPFATSLGINYPKYGATVQQMAFNANGQSVGGYLVMPQGEGPFPTIVYAPGLMTDVMENWAREAGAMAKRGYAGLLLYEPSIDFNTFDANRDIASYVLYATQERRALDLLATLPKIDMKRIGFVGWSNGAIIGSLLAGLEGRIQAYVFLGVPGMTTYTPEEKRALAAPTGAEFARWAARMSVIDNIAYVGHNEGAKFLFINGKHDANAMHDAKAFLAAAPKGTTWYVYSGSHGGTPASSKYIEAWLQKNL